MLPVADNEMALPEFELEKIRAVQNAEKKLVSEHELKIKQKDIVIKQQLVSADKQRQQLTQSSMQVQGEALEQVVKDHLTLAFSQDVIKDINNGVNGADIVHKVIYQNTHVGTILLECKNTKSFSNSWLTKLKDEMRELNIEAGLLITQTMPKEEVVIEARKRDEKLKRKRKDIDPNHRGISYYTRPMIIQSGGKSKCDYFSHKDRKQTEQDALNWVKDLRI